MSEKISRKSFLLFGILFLMLLPSLIGLFHPGFFVSDDGTWMVIRFSAFFQALRHGQFPVRYLSPLLNGYGYPVADFLYPLFMYMGVPIHILGANFVTTIKILFGLSLLVSGIGCFLWLKKLFDEQLAFVGALSYVYFPFHLWDVYKRGSMGELLAMSIVPFVLFFIEEKNLPLEGLTMGLLILSHNTLALFFLPLIIGYSLLRHKNILVTGKSLLLGLGFSAFFWIPALYDKQYTVFNSKTISNFSNYLFDPHVYGLLGIITIFIILASGLFLYKKNHLAIYFLTILLVTVFLNLPFSKQVWDILPGKEYIQYPFRLLSLAALAIGFLSCYVLSFAPKKHARVYLGLFIVFVALSAIPAILPSKYQYYPDSWYSTNPDSTTVQNEYLPIWVKQVPQNRMSIASIVGGKGTIQNPVANGEKITLSVNMGMPGTVEINTIYFPGWVIHMDGKNAKIAYNNTYGLMQVPVATGSHTIVAFFTETPVRLFADLISVFAIGTFGVLWYLTYKKL